jgi:hypothetical protein
MAPLIENHGGQKNYKNKKLFAFGARPIHKDKKNGLKFYWSVPLKEESVYYNRL